MAGKCSSCKKNEDKGALFGLKPDGTRLLTCMRCLQNKSAKSKGLDPMIGQIFELEQDSAKNAARFDEQNMKIELLERALSEIKGQQTLAQRAQTCGLAGCERSCHLGESGRFENYCGLTHAARDSDKGSPNDGVSPEDACASVDCYRACAQDPFRGGFFRHCSRLHAKYDDALKARRDLDASRTTKRARASSPLMLDDEIFDDAENILLHTHA